MNPIIRLENVFFEYRNHEDEGKVALNGISLDIDKGEFVAIVGRNGSGKSTLAKHINALILPDKGDVLVREHNTKDNDTLWEIRKNVGMVFQNPDNQIVATIVEEDVAFGPENLGLHRDEIIKRVNESLATVDMSEYSKKAPHMLSGGQKQRVAIAGVLALEPEIIVFDESTAMLDPQGRKEILDIATKLNEQGKTVILITHFMDEAALTDRIIVLSNGKVEMDGTPQQIFTNIETLEKLSLEAPKSVILKKMLNESGIDIDAGFSIESMAEAICQK